MLRSQSFIVLSKLPDAMPAPDQACNAVIDDGWRIVLKRRYDVRRTANFFFVRSFNDIRFNGPSGNPAIMKIASARDALLFSELSRTRNATMCREATCR
jgi:hypothetical protein